MLDDFFFFKQQTTVDFRMSEWSSDVCSSHLELEVVWAAGRRTQDRHGAWTPRRESSTFVIALHRQKRGYIGRQRLPWTGNRVVSRERSEEHTSELQSLMRISYAVFCLKKKTIKTQYNLSVRIKLIATWLLTPT